MNFKIQKPKNKLVVKNCNILVRKNTLKGILKAKSDSVITDEFTGNSISFHNDNPRVSSNEYMFVASKKSMEVNLDGYAIFPKELLIYEQRIVLDEYFRIK